MTRASIVAIATLLVGTEAVAQQLQAPPSGVPRAVTVARTTELPRCTVYVDGAATAGGSGSVDRPHRTIAAAVAAAPEGAVICVAEGVYRETLAAGEKAFTLAGGFQRGSRFRVRDSAVHVTRAQGAGTGSFLRIDDPGPSGGRLTAVDGFEITGYAQAVVRSFHLSQRFDLTDNHIHDNHCRNNALVGAAFVLENVSGRIEGNVIRNNSCGRGGGGFVNDAAAANAIRIERNLIEGNAGLEPDASHGGGLYLFGGTLRITGNLFTRNSVTQWGGGLYVGAYRAGGQPTNALLNWNVYRDNRAGNGGGGFFCDDGAACVSWHEIYDRNCGGNILLDSAAEGSGGTTARFGHLTNVSARTAGCDRPGPGVRVDRGENSDPDAYSIVNAIFWGNAEGLDLQANCDTSCRGVRVVVSHSMVQTRYGRNGFDITFGDGIVAPTDPLFADPAGGDVHLRSRFGRWTPSGRVRDAETSPLIGRGFNEGRPTDAPPEAGDRIELGAYGNSAEASFAQSAAVPAPPTVAQAPALGSGAPPPPPPGARSPGPGVTSAPPPPPPTAPASRSPAAATPPRPQAGPTVAGCAVFPADNIWNTPIDHLPVHPRSQSYVASIGVGDSLRPDFGSGQHEGAPIGIPFVVVPIQQPRVPIRFARFADEDGYPAESDAGPYPVPRDAPIEGGPRSREDRHVIVVQEGRCLLFELYRAVPNPDGSWNAVSAARFDLESHALRPDGWTSADAAGLPVFPGLVRYDEVAAGAILHALRFTVRRSHNSYVWPARHRASRLTDPSLPPLGTRFRLRASFDISRFSRENQVILRALQTYGMILADNGSNWFLSGAPDPRWNDDRLRELLQVRGRDFEAVDVTPLMIDASSGQARQR
jgi:hypothetical protein